MTTRAVTLARVSNKDQEDGLSLDAQHDRLELYAKNKGLTVVKHFEIIESASMGQRKQFEEIVKYVKKQSGTTAIIADTVDRVTRNFRDAVNLHELVGQGKVELHFLREGLTINKESNSSSHMHWDMAVMFAKNYALTISDNVKRSVKLKMEKGELLGPAPFGYINTEKPDGSKWAEPDPQTAPIVKELYELYSTGNFSQRELRALVQRKYDINIPHASLARILTNKFYAGVITYKSYNTSTKHPYKVIISVDNYEKVQQIINHRAGKDTVKLKRELNFVYSGLIRCGECGAVVSGQLKRKGKNKYIYYRCYKGKEHGFKYIREIDRNVEKIKGKRRKGYEAFTDGVVKEDLFREMDLKYEQEIELLELERKKLSEARNDFYDTSKLLLMLTQRAKDIFLASDIEQRREIIKLLTSKIVLSDKSVDITVQEGLRSMFAIHSVSNGVADDTVLEPVIRQLIGYLSDFKEDVENLILNYNPDIIPIS